MKACRGLICSAAVFAVAGVAFAVPPTPQLKHKMVPVDLGQPQPSGSSAAGFPKCESTGFEAAEAICAWEAGLGLCGSTFICRDRNVDPPYPACSAAAPNPDNCCVAKPHPINDWFMSGSAQHCQEPSIRTDHPASGAQHLRWQRSTLGGNPAGCTAPAITDQGAASTACRLSAFTSNSLPTGVDYNPGVTTTSFDISRDVAAGTPGAEMAISQQSPIIGPLYMRIQYAGYVFAYDFTLGDYVYIGAFTNGGQYYNFEMVHDVCGDSIRWYWDGELVHENTWTGSSQTPSPEQNVFLHDNVTPGIFDMDNFIVDRVLINQPACPSICGDGNITGLEECESSDDSCCPGQCGAVGTAEECACPEPTNTIFECSARAVVNGANGPFVTDGGFYSYVADAPFTSVDTCGSGFDSQIFWGFTADCGQYLDFNDDCFDDDYAGGQSAGDPNASCYGGATFEQESCVCNPTVAGTTYTFLVAEWQAAAPGTTLIPPFCSSTVVNITKKTSCALGGPIPGGACCNQITGTCTDGVEAAACAGQYDVYSDNKLCSMVDCDALTGACCNTAPGAGGACVETSQAECPTSSYQSWAGPNTSCDDITCEEVTGSCCDGLTGTCATTLQSQCGPASTWTEGGSCSTCVARTGACCVEPDVLTAECSATTLAQCNAAGGLWSDSQDCANVECTPNFIPIPTVSEWGLAVLALMLLIGGKIYFSRREAAMA